MKKIRALVGRLTILGAFSVFLALFSSVVYADQAAVRLDQQLKSFVTYQANFLQETRSSNGNLIQSGTGLVKIKRPGKFYWVTKKPTEQRLITDGKTLWIYDVDLAQATSQPLSSRTSIDPAALLSGGAGKLSDLFVVRTLSPGFPDDFVLTPKGESEGFKKITMMFAHNQLVKMIVVNNLSQTSEFSFTKISVNQPLSDEIFVFKPPKGVDVVKQ